VDGAADPVKPADVAPLLLAVPPPDAGIRLLARVERRLFFTVVFPARRGDGHHETYRVVCPVCGRRRLAQFRGFDVCSDCGWLHIQSESG
jgi:hypothetical protein